MDELVPQNKYRQNKDLAQFEIGQLPTNQSLQQQPEKISKIRLTEDFLVLERTIILKNAEPATAGNYGIMMLANCPIWLLGAQCRFATAGSDAGTVTLDLEKLADGTAKGAGVSMLASTFNLKGTVDTVQSALPTATVGNAQLTKGQAAALKLSGTPTAIADLIVSTWWGVLTKDLPV